MFRLRNGDCTIEVDSVQELAACLSILKVGRRKTKAHTAPDSDRIERKRAYQRAWRAKHKVRLAKLRKEKYEREKGK